MDPSSNLFLLNVPISAEPEVLLCNVGDGEYVSWLSERVRRLTVLHRDYEVLQSLRARLRAHPGATVSESILPESNKPRFDLALVQVPKSRGLSRAMLYTCLRSLRIDAQLYCAGSNRGGANTAQSDLGELIGSEIPTLATKASHRIFRAVRPSSVDAPTAWDEPWCAKRHRFVVANQEHELFTQPGVFSHDHPDPGTVLLIETLFPRLREWAKGPRVLDAACGYGLLGVCAGRELRASHVVFADIDLLALQCLRRSYSDATIVPCDLRQSPSLPHAPFDLILCNPPFHQEHSKDLSFMHGFASNAPKLLAPGGRLALVANSFLPYRKLLGAHFSSVETLACTSQYQVLECA